MSTQNVQTRTWQDVEIPPAGAYDIDPAHTTVEIIARHMMIAKVRGHFEQFSGRIDIAEDPTDSTAEVHIDAASIDTAEEQRDAHLRSPDFLDVERWPDITFTARNPRHVDGQRWKVDGELTIRDRTRPVDVDVTLEGVATDPWGNTRAFLSASLRIDREDFGVTWNQVLETGGVLVGKELVAEIDLQAVLKG